WHRLSGDGEGKAIELDGGSGLVDPLSDDVAVGIQHAVFEFVGIRIRAGKADLVAAASEGGSIQHLAVVDHAGAGVGRVGSSHEVAIALRDPHEYVEAGVV